MSRIGLKWIETAKWAASGGNAQPWLVSYDAQGGSVRFELSIDPEYRAHASPMDVEGLASVFALGGFAYCLTAAAANDGYRLIEKKIISAASLWSGRVVLEYRLEPTAASRFSNQDIQSRRSDRGRFLTAPVSEGLATKLGAIARSYPNLSLTEFSARTQPAKSELEDDLLKLEKIRWRNATLLGALLDELSFGKEISRNRDKIPANQLGVSTLDQLLMRALRRFPLLRNLFKVGFERIAARKALTAFIRDCDRIYFLGFKAHDPKNEFAQCFDFGSCFQEQWLEVNSSGVSFQVLGLPLIALANWREGSTVNLAPKHKSVIGEITENFKQKFDLDLKVPLLGFRIGYPTQTARQALRKEVVCRRLNSEAADSAGTDYAQSKDKPAIT